MFASAVKEILDVICLLATPHGNTTLLASRVVFVILWSIALILFAVLVIHVTQTGNLYHMSMHDGERACELDRVISHPCALLSRRGGGVRLRRLRWWFCRGIVRFVVGKVALNGVRDVAVARLEIELGCLGVAVRDVDKFRNAFVCHRRCPFVDALFEIRQTTLSPTMPHLTDDRHLSYERSSG